MSKIKFYKLSDASIRRKILQSTTYNLLIY